MFAVYTVEPVCILTQSYFLPSSIRPGISVLADLRLPVREQQRHCPGAADGVHQLLLQSHHVLLHEPTLPAGIPRRLQLLPQPVSRQVLTLCR